MIDEVTRKEDLTRDQLIHAMQNAWSHFRNAQLYAFCAGAPVLTWARENEADFLTYCTRNTVSGKELETLVVELMLAEDGDGEAISRERRAEYGNCIGWFADHELCPETDPDKAVALAGQKGRITGIAREYRTKKDDVNPKAKAVKEKVQAAKAARSKGVASAATASEIIAGSTSVSNAEGPVFLTLHDRATGEAPLPVHDGSEGGHEATALLALLAEEGVPEARSINSADDGTGPEIRIMLDIRDEKGVPHLFGPIFDDEIALQLAHILADQLAGCKTAAA